MREKSQPRMSDKSKRREPGTEAHRSKGPTMNGDRTHYRRATSQLHSIQKHESSVHVILVYESSAEPTPSYL